MPNVNEPFVIKSLALNFIDENMRNTFEFMDWLFYMYLPTDKVIEIISDYARDYDIELPHEIMDYIEAHSLL